MPSQISVIAALILPLLYRELRSRILMHPSSTGNSGDLVIHSRSSSRGAETSKSPQGVTTWTQDSERSSSSISLLQVTGKRHSRLHHNAVLLHKLRQPGKLSIMHGTLDATFAHFVWNLPKVCPHYMESLCMRQKALSWTEQACVTAAGIHSLHGAD